MMSTISRFLFSETYFIINFSKGVAPSNTTSSCSKRDYSKKTLSLTIHFFPFKFHFCLLFFTIWPVVISTFIVYANHFSHCSVDFGHEVTVLNATQQREAIQMRSDILSSSLQSKHSVSPELSF